MPLVLMSKMDILIRNEEVLDNIRQILGDSYVWVYMDQSRGCEASLPPSR